MKRVLILVLSTDKPPYDKLYQASVDTWDRDEIDDVDTVFYFGGANKTSTEHVLFTPVGDDFFDMGRKTLCAFEWALANREFDYIFRANASLYIHKPGLLRYVQQWPETGLALGVVADCGQKDGERFSFLWGPSYMLSRDVVELVVKNKDAWDHSIMEDNAVSRLLTSLNIPLDNRGSMASIAMSKGWYEITYYEKGASGGATLYSLSELKERLPGQFCFRVKDDANRENDVKLMRELHEVFK